MNGSRSAPPPPAAVVGLDRGVTVLAADSNGRQYPRLAAGRKKRRVLQRAYGPP